MTQSTRRPGFRLPWSSESDDAPEAPGSQDAAEHGDASATEDSATSAPDTATSKGNAPVGEGETVVADIDPTASGAPKPVTAAAENGTSATDAAADAPPAATPAVEAHAEATADADESDFLRSLVDAMRGVAQEERTASVAELRRLVDERVALLETRAKDRVEELRRKTELDVTGVGDWAKGEIERINAEAARKVEARRQQLEEQLAEHETRSTAEVTTVRERVAAYEQELEAFFNQLTEIKDPASFVAAARRMPKPPSLDAGAATPLSASTATPTASLNARLAQLGIDRSGKAAAKPASGATPSPAADPTPGAEPGAQSAASTPAPAETGAAQATSAAAAAADAPAPAGERDAQLAERLAELDAHQEPNTATAQTGTGDDADEIATAIMVKGLGSFGAITSFKQRLERLATVRSVTLSLGPTGEFVYRATHPRQIDLGGAISTLEPGSTVDRQADGSLRVTVQPR
jgi:hypothetical protein